jgi:hypothetical protein
MVERSQVAPWVWVLSGVAAPATLVGAWFLMGISQTDLFVVSIAVVVVAAGAGIAIPTRTGTTRTVAHGVGAAVPLILVDDMPLFDRAAAIAVGLGGLGVVWLVSAIRGKEQRLLIPVMLQSLSAYAVYAMLIVSLGSVAPFDQTVGWPRTFLFLTAALGAFIFELAWASLVVAGRDRGGIRYRTLRGLGDADSYLAITGAGALFGLSFNDVGWWALVISALPYSFTHTALARFRNTKTTYEQTLRALAQIPEVAGHAAPGHALAAARLGRQLALDLRLDPRRVDRAEHASLMHEVGLVALNEPGIAHGGYTDFDIARWGSEVLGESRHLSEVADAVRRQYDAYRSPGGAADPTLGPLPRIVRVVGAFIRGTERGRSVPEVLDDLQRGTSDDFDPEVVAALRVRLERTGGLRHPVAR